MSNYTSHNRERLQNLYGYYCNMCKDMQIIPVSYVNFNDDLYIITKKNYKSFKKSTKE